jgi:uncharacterized protein YbjT (DUF2867 family)
MRIVVLGATGGTGRLVIEEALKRGHDVACYVRNPVGLSAGSDVQIFTGQLNDTSAMQAAISGAGAVLCCLGTHEKKNVDLMQKALPLIIQVMQRAHVPRLVLLSAYGVGDTARSASLIARLAYRLVAASVFLDKELAEALLSGSGLKWTGIYPVILTDGVPTGAVEVRPMTQVQKVAGLPKVSRADVARVMLDAVSDDGTIGQRLLVSSQGSVR